MFHWFSRRRIIVENALMDDAAALLDIQMEAFSYQWSEEEFRRLLANETYFCLVAREENWVTRRLLGFVMVRQVVDEAEIITIATRVRSRRSGIGRKLMDAAMRQLNYERAQKLFLEVDENNVAALKLYESLRFKQISERKGYYKGHALGVGEPATAFVMQRDLG